MVTSKAKATKANAASRNANDFDPDMADFIQRSVNSFTKWDLIRFFHHNPHAVDHAENLARHVSRDVLQIKPALDELVASEILRAREVSDIKVYSLTDDAATRGLIERFFQACDDKTFRAKAIRYVIQLEADRS
jgi:hypothetical protein